MGKDSNEVKYVSEELFKERTGNLATAVSTLTERVETVISDHEKRLRGSEHEDNEIKLTLVRVCQQLDIEEGTEELRQKTKSVQIANKALIVSMLTLTTMVVVQVTGWVLKALKVI